MRDDQEDFWSAIERTELPIVLYGTGNGADMILDEFAERGIKAEGCFASDGFVRERTFRGFHVISYSDAQRIFGRMAVILAFGTHDAAVISNIKRISSANELYMPDMQRDESGHLFDREYAIRNEERIRWAYSILEDDISRRSFESVIRYRLSGRIGWLLEDQADEAEAWKLLGIGSDETYMDIGAYNGDTISRFISIAGSWRDIYGFEPDARSFKKLKRNTEGLPGIHLYNSFISDKPGSVPFSGGKGRGSCRMESSSYADAATIDGVLGGKPVTLIKFDTEGFEREALDGGRRTIAEYAPRMILSAYHRIDDFWILPEKVLGICGSYRFYMRKARALPYWDTSYYIF